MVVSVTTSAFTFPVTTDVLIHAAHNKTAIPLLFFFSSFISFSFFFPFTSNTIHIWKKLHSFEKISFFSIRKKSVCQSTDIHSFTYLLISQPFCSHKSIFMSGKFSRWRRNLFQITTIFKSSIF